MGRRAPRRLTLIEYMVGLAFLGLLAAILVPVVTRDARRPGVQEPVFNVRTLYDARPTPETKTSLDE